MSWSPFNDFPREMGFPDRRCIVRDMDELLRKAGNSNKIYKDVFTSLYAFKEVNGKRGLYDSAKIRHIFFDFDNPVNSLDCIRKLHKYCTEKNLRHTMFFSGGGFHFYIAVLYPNFLNDKKTAVSNVQRGISSDLEFKIGVKKEDPTVCLDGHVIGDIARMVRIPNTLNGGRQRYCIPIREEDIEFLTLEGFEKLAEKQRFGRIKIYGRNYLDLKEFDGDAFDKNFEVNDDFLKEAGEIVDVDIKTFPSCIRVLAEKRNLSHQERYMVILYCRAIGLNYRSTINLMKKVLDAKKFNHSTYEEKQPFMAYRKVDFEFYGCETLKNMGYCKDNGCEGIKI